MNGPQESATTSIGSNEKSTIATASRGCLAVVLCLRQTSPATLCPSCFGVCDVLKPFTQAQPPFLTPGVPCVYGVLSCYLLVPSVDDRLFFKFHPVGDCVG